MINSSLKKQCGAATFLITTVLLVSITMIVIFAANYSLMQQKISANLNRKFQAFEAAEAGLEFGINYLQKNSATILATRAGGYVQPYSDSNTSNVSLANGSKYTITYSNPIANNYTLIQVSSTGTNSDGTASNTVSEKVQFGSLLFKTPTSTLTTKGTVELGGSSNIINTSNNATIAAGGDVTISGSGQTTISTGTGSTASKTGADVQSDVSSLSNLSSNSLFASYFGVSTTTAQNSANYTYTNLGNYNSVLNGKTGSVIWINQTSGTATINSTTVVGSAASPVLLIVNGNFSISGTAQIYGFIYVIGGSATDVVTGSASINGGMVSEADLNLKGSTTITYNPSLLTTLQQTVNTYYAKVPGSWKDY